MRPGLPEKVPASPEVGLEVAGKPWTAKTSSSFLPIDFGHSFPCRKGILSTRRLSVWVWNVFGSSTQPKAMLSSLQCLSSYATKPGIESIWLSPSTWGNNIASDGSSLKEQNNTQEPKRNSGKLGKPSRVNATTHLYSIRWLLANISDPSAATDPQRIVTSSHSE